MARKKRGRPKKKPVTYDSRETKFILGLLILGLGIFSLISYFVADQGIFGIFRSIFGNATIVAAVFFINMGLALFGVNYFLTTKRSLLSQFLLVLLVGIIFAAVASPLFLRAESYGGRFGGIVGYELANFSKNYIFLNLTAPIAIIAVVILLPALFSQNLSEFFTNVVKFVDKIVTSIAGLFAPKQVERTEEPLQNNSPFPTTVGGFRAGMKNSYTGQALSQNSRGNSQSGQIDSRNTETKKLPDFAGLSQSNSKLSDSASAVEIRGNEANQGAAGIGGIHSGGVGNVSIVSTIDNTDKYDDWKLPPTSLLNPVPELDIPEEDVKNNSLIIEQTLNSFGIEAKVVEAMVGPSVTQYAIDIALGIKVAKISNLKNDLALALATSSNAVRIEVPIPGTSYVGIEVPNSQRRPVFFRELIDYKGITDPKYMLPVTVGKDISGKPIIGDIQKMPHLLIAGATGSGKSVLTNSFILSLLMHKSPAEVRFIMVDPKQVELSDYNGIPHLIYPVITDMKLVISALRWAVDEMERRYTVFKDAQVRNLEGYNEKQGYTAMPYIVVVIDEMADMMLTAGRADIESNIVRLAQKARATGIHLILATQRPSVNVITGIIKANIPGRIGMSVTTGVDSRVILDVIGAESLLGKGDMLYKEPDKNRSARVQGVFITQEEIQRVVAHIKDQTEEVEYIELKSPDSENHDSDAGVNLSGDNLFADAVRVVVATQKGSASLLQRKLKLGYNRAARIIDEMEEMGIVGPENGSKPREVLITDAESFLEQISGNSN